MVIRLNVFDHFEKAMTVLEKGLALRKKDDYEC